MLRKNRIGETVTSTSGQKMTIIAQRVEKTKSGKDKVVIDVQFEDGTVVYGKQYGHFKRGKVGNHNIQRFGGLSEEEKCRAYRKLKNEYRHKNDYSGGNRYQRWTEKELVLLESRKYNDVELAKMLGRSLQSIEHKRLKLRLKQGGNLHNAQGLYSLNEHVVNEVKAERKEKDMTFAEKAQNLVLPSNVIEPRDLLVVFRYLTGRLIALKDRREFLIEYRFDYDSEIKEWRGDKNKVYEQLLKNYKFDIRRYKNFDDLLKVAEAERSSDINTLNDNRTSMGIPKKVTYVKLDQEHDIVGKTDEKVSKEGNIANMSEKKVAKRITHKYTYDENKMIIEAKVSDEELATKLGLTVKKIVHQRANLARIKGITTLEDLERVYGNKEEKKEEDQPKSDIIVNEKEQSIIEKKEDSTVENKIIEKSGSSKKIQSLVDRTLNLLSEFEDLSKELEGKEAALRTKSRYEHLLKVLIEKDLQFFALTAGNDKEKAQNRYLKAIGFSDVEIEYFRSN